MEMDKEKLKEQVRMVMAKARAVMSEIKDNFKADEDATGARKIQSRFVNLWKSGMPGRVTLIACSVVILLLPVFVFRGCGSDSPKAIAVADAEKANQNKGGDTGASGKEDAASADVAAGDTGMSREERERLSGQNQIKEILALAKKSAEEDDNINFCGFFTGMSRYDAQDLAAHYKLKEGEYMAFAWPGKAVSRLWFSLKGVRRITGGGNTIDELAQAVANRVGNLKGSDGKLVHRTIDGVMVTFSGEGLAIQNDSLASQEPVVTKEHAQKEANAQKECPQRIKCLQSIIVNMVAIPGMSFKIGKYEVTQAQWHEFMGNNPSKFKGENNPIENVSWKDSYEFINKLNVMPEVKALGLTFRLPTEREWEYACRAGATHDYCKLADGTEITENTLGEVAWFYKTSGDTTHPVGQKKPNAFGLYDMHGNVAEWSEDLFMTRNTRSRIEFEESHHVYRGGSWNSVHRDCKASSQDYTLSSDGCSNERGFRLAATQK